MSVRDRTFKKFPAASHLFPKDLSAGRHCVRSRTERTGGGIYAVVVRADSVRIDIDEQFL